MPIKVTSNSDGVWITWGTPDEGVSTTFRIKKSDPDEEILKKLVRLTRFIGSQMGELMAEITELETEILGGAQGATTSPPAPATTATVADPSAPRILMTPQTSDLPAGGAPVETFGWGSMPTTSVPPQLAAPEAGGWEMIPPGEM